MNEIGEAFRNDDNGRREKAELVVDGIPLLVPPGEAFKPAAMGGCARWTVGEQCPVRTTGNGLHSALDFSMGRAVMNLALRLDVFSLEEWREVGKMAAVAVFLPGAPVARMLVQLQGAVFQAPMIVNRDAGDRKRALEVIDFPGEKSIEFVGVREDEVAVACVMLGISSEGIWSALRQCILAAPEKSELGTIRNAMLSSQTNTSTDEMFSEAMRRLLMPHPSG